MKRYWIFSTALVILMLIIYGLVAFLGMDGLTGESAPVWMSSGGGVLVALGGILLLIADVVLPVPSSAVMIANGVIYGIVLGTIISLIGTVGAALIGYWIGKRGSKLVERIVSPEEMARSRRMVKHWGPMAIVSTRPIPMIAETTAIMAGASGLSWVTVLWASLLGSIPQAILFAITGATAASFDNMALAFGLALLIAGIVWVIGRQYQAAVEDEALTTNDNDSSDPEQLFGA